MLDHITTLRALFHLGKYQRGREARGLGGGGGQGGKGGRGARGGIYI